MLFIDKLVIKLLISSSYISGADPGGGSLLLYFYSGYCYLTVVVIEM